MQIYFFLKYHIFLKKTSGLSIVYSKCGHEYGKIFKEGESIELLKILGIEEQQKILTMPEENMDQEFRLKNIRLNDKLFN